MSDSLVKRGIAQLCGKSAYCADRRGFSHAPGMNDVHAEFLLERSENAFGHRGATNDHPFQRRQVEIIFKKMVQQQHPNCGDGRGKGNVMFAQQLIDRVRLHAWTGKNELGTDS